MTDIPAGHPNQRLKDAKTAALVGVLGDRLPVPPGSILVVGCGTGREAGLLARSFAADTVGTDIGGQFPFDHDGSAPARLVAMDACALRFPDESFDLVYSFHALEHIGRPAAALAEMARVLRRGGSYLIGTPNRARLVGYVGSPVPLRLKVRFNLQDYRMRLLGRWSNAAGAHAGFTQPELRHMCRAAFGAAEGITGDYYRRLYPARTVAVDALIRTGAGRLLFPCVYVTGRKP